MSNKIAATISKYKTAVAEIANADTALQPSQNDINSLTGSNVAAIIALNQKEPCKLEYVTPQGIRLQIPTKAPTQTLVAQIPRDLHALIKTICSLKGITISKDITAVLEAHYRPLTP